MLDREEITAKLVTDYRLELAQLTDAELLATFRAMEGIKSLTAEEWAEIRRKERNRPGGKPQ